MAQPAWEGGVTATPYESSKGEGKGEGKKGDKGKGAVQNHPGYHWVGIAGNNAVAQDYKRPYVKKACDLNATVAKYIELWNFSSGNDVAHLRAKKNDFNNLNAILPDPAFTKDQLPAQFHGGSATANGINICNRFLFGVVNKLKTPINTFAFSPHGRRCVVGSSSGDISIWNCSPQQSFHFEHGQNIHHGAVRVVVYDYSNTMEEVLCTGDQQGQLKFWDKNFYNFQTTSPHNGIGLRDLVFSPGSQKFATCAEDKIGKIFDMGTLKEERELLGNGYEIRAIHWHPSRALIATGSKDNLLKLYDPRQSNAITTLYHHKNSITKLKFSPNGEFLASTGKDNSAFLLDVRTMKLRYRLKGHQSEISSLSWHPFFANNLVTGGLCGNIFHWNISSELHDEKTGCLRPHDITKSIHDGSVAVVQHHPFGHVLTSGGADGSIKFFTRLRPGDSDPQDLVPPLTDFEPYPSKGKGKGKWWQKGEAAAEQQHNLVINKKVQEQKRRENLAKARPLHRALNRVGVLSKTTGIAKEEFFKLPVSEDKKRRRDSADLHHSAGLRDAHGVRDSRRDGGRDGRRDGGRDSTRDDKRDGRRSRREDRRESQREGWQTLFPGGAEDRNNPQNATKSAARSETRRGRAASMKIGEGGPAEGTPEGSPESSPEGSPEGSPEASNTEQSSSTNTLESKDPTPELTPDLTPDTSKDATPSSDPTPDPTPDTSKAPSKESSTGTSEESGNLEGENPQENPEGTPKTFVVFTRSPTKSLSRARKQDEERDEEQNKSQKKRRIEDDNVGPYQTGESPDESPDDSPDESGQESVYETPISSPDPDASPDPES